MAERPGPRVVVAIGTVAGATLALQVLLTRLLSAVFLYHFAFLAISLALLGTGGGGMLVYVRPHWFENRLVESLLARYALVLAVFLVVLAAVLAELRYSVPYGATAGGLTSRFAITLTIACVAAAIPFLAAGVVIALAISRYVRWVGFVYAFDLGGAALGAIVMVPLLWLLNAPTLVVALSAVAAIAAALFGWREPAIRTAALALAALGMGLAVAAQTGALFNVPTFSYPGLGTRSIVQRWTPLARVVGYAPVTPRLRIVSYDRDGAPVMRYRRGDPPLDWRALGLGPQSIPYALTPAGRTLVIGGGGGRDIHNALSSGQRSVDVIEVNRAIRDVVDNDFRQWSGAPYSLPGVHTTIGDGRSTLGARRTKYQHINIGFTNTLGASAGSSYALTEANLYTVEAFEEYFDHLLPGGTLAVTRLYRFSGEEALRATVLMLESLRRYGVADPQRNVVVVLEHSNGNILSGTVIAQLRPFTSAELARIEALARVRGGWVSFAPGGPFIGEWRTLAMASSPTAFCRSYRIDVCAPTDDHPFFFQVSRFPDPSTWARGYIFSPTPFVVLMIALAVLMALSVLAFVVPLLAAPRASRPPVSSLTFFAAIGIGFLTLEIVLIQRFVLFLGFPTYALSVVLFSLLLFTGLGALLSTRWARPRRVLTIALAVASSLIIAGAFLLQPLLRDLITAPFVLRVAISVMLLAPLGVTLGMAMPIGVGRLTALHPGSVPWAWGINAIMSVLASTLAVVVAIAWGFSAATALAACCYLVALADVGLGRWPAPA